MITRCPCCVGKKTLMGLGCIVKKCPECKGIGHIKVDETPIESIGDELKKFTDGFANTIKPSRGRPKKVSHGQQEA